MYYPFAITIFRFYLNKPQSLKELKPKFEKHKEAKGSECAMITFHCIA